LQEGLRSQHFLRFLQNLSQFLPALTDQRCLEALYILRLLWNHFKPYYVKSRALFHLQGWFFQYQSHCFRLQESHPIRWRQDWEAQWTLCLAVRFAITYRIFCLHFQFWEDFQDEKSFVAALTLYSLLGLKDRESIHCINLGLELSRRIN
jgi:hypothetical protein